MTELDLLKKRLQDLEVVIGKLSLVMKDLDFYAQRVIKPREVKPGGTVRGIKK